MNTQDALVKKLEKDLKDATDKKAEIDQGKIDADANMVTRKADKVKSDKAYDDKKKEYDLEFAKIKPEQDTFDGL